MCDCCHGESGGREVGVAAIPGVPMSIQWCSECLKHDAFPAFVFDHDFIFVALGSLENLNDWAKERVCWFQGKYIGFLDYVKHITPEQVEKELLEAADAEQD
jgi:hypothetical protein